MGLHVHVISSRHTRNNCGTAERLWQKMSCISSCKTSRIAFFRFLMVLIVRSYDAGITSTLKYISFLASSFLTLSSGHILNVETESMEVEK